MAKEILQIAEFKFVAWKFISAIYESGWNKLITNDKDMFFRQCVLFQFNRKPMKSILALKSTKVNKLISQESPLLSLPGPAKVS